VIRVYAPEGSRTVGVWEAGWRSEKGLFRFLRRQPICQAAFNGEFGNSGDASVHADGAKSKFQKRVARALRLRNSLSMATQIWCGVRHCDRFRDYGPHSAQTEQRGETVLLIAPSRRSQFHFVARPDVGRVYKSRFPSRCQFPTEALFFQRIPLLHCVRHSAERVAPAIAIAAGRPFSWTLCHFNCRLSRTA
jgi:hypothetical protein